MWKALGAGAAVLGLAGAAAALECVDWRRLTEDQKIGRIERMIESHLTSNVGKRYTSENSVQMRRCLYEFVEDIRDEFDGVCLEDRATPKNALDQIFDKYFLSCVQ